MAATVYQKIQLRRGSPVALTTLDPTPLEGEIIVELGSGKFKIGDGLRSWTALPYANATDSIDITDVVGLAQALAAKQDVGNYITASDYRLSDDRVPLAHTHPISQIVDLQAALDLKQPVGSYVTTSDSRLTDSRVPLAHTHTVANITNLQSILDGKQSAGSYVLATDSRLTDSRSPTAHTHIIANITNLQSVLDGKQVAGSYVLSSDSRLTDDRTPVSHTHDIADVTGLSAALDGKATLVGGLVPLSQLPVDDLPSGGGTNDVVTAANFASLPVTGATSTLYVTTNNNKLYYWGGSSYLEITATVDVSSTDSIAEGSTNLYFTTVRAAAAAPVQSVAGRTGTVTLSKSDVALANVDNTSDANKPISTATQNALDAKAAATHTHALSAITGVGTAATKDFPATGNAATGEVVIGSDTRLTNSRAPTTHASTHASGGTDAITPESIGAATTSHTHSAAQVTGLANVATSGSYSDLSGRPSLVTVATTGAYSDLTGRPALSTVATTGSYADLSNKPTIPSAQVNSDWSAVGGVSQILNKPSFSAVATSGSYLDLSNTPSSYSLPAATSSSLGGVKVGSGISVDVDGTISVSSSGSGTLDIASATKLGGIKVGTGVSIDANGVLSVTSTSGGTVSQVSVTTANGISGAVANATSTPAITLTLGAITPTSVVTNSVSAAGILYPTTKGTSGQVLTTNGSTAASWTSLATAATTGSYTDLINKPTIPAAQINSDWTSVSGLSQILNKPTFATVATSGAYADLSGRPALVTVATTGAYSDLTGRPSLSTVATTGSYADLSNKPTIPSAQVNSDWAATSGIAQILNKPALSSVATSGSYSDLSGRPALVTVATTGAYSDLTGRPALSTVATTGSYTDLTSKPTIPSAQVNSDWSATSGIAQILNKPTFAAVATSGSYTDLSGKPTFATVATTGSYTDLLNKPTIPAASTVAPSDGASTAAIGTSTSYARADHQHKLPTPSAIGAAAYGHAHAISSVTGLQTALNAKQDAGSYATLINGVVPNGQLPNYVYADLSGLPASGESGKFYTTATDGKVYRWTGTGYAEWLQGVTNTDYLTEGTTRLYFTTARASAAAPVQSVAGKTGTVALIKDDVGLANVDNTTDLNKPVSTATQTALNAKASTASPTFTGIPAAPTPGADTNTTQLATTAFVLGQASSATPSAPGSAAVGTSLKYARGDHTHAAQTITLTGDVTGTGTGSFASTIAASSVTYTKMQNVSATDKLLGRASAGAGTIEEITCTSVGRSIISAASIAAAKTTLGLSTVASTGSFNDLTDVPAAQDGFPRTGGTMSGSLYVTGSVGVGAAATNKFDVVGGRSTFAANSEQYAIGAKFNAAGGAVYFGATNATNTPDAAIYNAGGGQLMVLQTGGNVGIGVASPAAKLDVAGNVNINSAAGTALTVTNTGTGNSFIVNDIAADTTPFVIDAAGNVGIGTATPTAELDLQSAGGTNLRVYDTGGAAATITIKSGTTEAQVGCSGSTCYFTNYAAAGSLSFSQTGAGQIAFTVNSLQGLRIDSNANVSVGGSAAVNTLRYFDVNNSDNGAAAGAIIRLITRNTADTAATSVDLVKYKNGAFYINNNEPSTSASTIFNVAGAERMRITSTGTVGIGKAVPGAALHVANVSTNPTLIVDALGTQDNAIWFTRSGAAKWYVYNDNATNSFSIGNTAVNPTFKIDSAGNVGIGTTTPTQKLHVAGNISATTTYSAFDSSARSYSREWIELPNYTGILSGNNNAMFKPNDSVYGSWKISGTRNGWAGIEFSDSSTSLMQGLDGNYSGFHRNGYGWQFYWSNGELRCLKNTYGGGTNAAVLDSVNYSNYIAESNKTVINGRLGLVSGNAYAYTDTAASTTLYYSPYLGNNISLYDTVTSTWKVYEFSEVAIANTGLAANTNYDVFVFNNVVIPATIAPTATPRPTATPVPVVTATATPVPVVTATATPVPVVTATATPVPVVTATATPVPVVTATATPVPVVAPTATPRPTSTPTPAPLPFTALALTAATSLELVPWTSASARATELTLLSGIYVKTGSYNKRYVGTIRTNAAAQFANSEAQRFVWNMYNKRPTRMYLEDATPNTYASGASVIARVWRNLPATFVTEAVFGLETPIHAALTSGGAPSTGAGFTYINEDLIDTSITFQATVHSIASTAGNRSSSVEFTSPRARGSHKYYPMERINASSSVTFNNFQMSISFEG